MYMKNKTSFSKISSRCHDSLVKKNGATYGEMKERPYCGVDIN